jgi:catechol 2,3-dioxygenase-like lactoylglutathione lyase family enzyme
MDTSVPAQGAASFQQGWITGINHLALHVRDVDEAMRFWTGLFGGEPYRVFAGKRTFHVTLPGVVLAFFEREGLIGWQHEFPHYAFTVTPDGMRGGKRVLDAAGVKTHRPWTRNREEALMYFRDPSGNLFELYCPHYDRVGELALARANGGDFEPPIEDLRYDWRG